VRYCKQRKHKIEAPSKPNTEKNKEIEEQEEVARVNEAGFSLSGENSFGKLPSQLFLELRNFDSLLFQ